MNCAWQDGPSISVSFKLATFLLFILFAPPLKKCTNVPLQFEHFLVVNESLIKKVEDKKRRQAKCRWQTFF